MAAKTKEQPINSELDKDVLVDFCTRIVAAGFCSAEELREHYGNETYTKLIALVFRTHRALREVRRPWKTEQDALGYEWADQRYSQAQIRKMPPELAVAIEKFKKTNAKYADYEKVAVRCVWTNRVLGAQPKKEDSGDELNVFDRFDGNGHGKGVILPAYCLRAMASKGLPMLGKEAALARRIGWKAVRIINPTIEIVTRPIIDEDGRTGLGLKRSESMPAGTTFTIEATVPTSVIRPDEMIRLLTLCGDFVRLSPARSSGFGDFEVLGAE